MEEEVCQKSLHSGSSNGGTVLPLKTLLIIMYLYYRLARLTGAFKIIAIHF